MWFLAMWFVTSQKSGVSALGLQRVLGMGGYDTAWTWLHKLHRSMVRPARERLTDEIEIDETYVGGPAEGKRGRETENKAIVVVATEKRAYPIGHIRLRRIKEVSAEGLLQFIRETIEPGATTHTDGWSGYAGLADAGYPYRSTALSAGPEPAHEVMPRVHKVAALLKRWLLGTLQGSIQHQHLDYYLENLHFASTAVALGLLASCFIASPNRLWPSGRRPTTTSLPPRSRNLDDGDTHFGTIRAPRRQLLALRL
jgi:transposase-like protein